MVLGKGMQAFGNKNHYAILPLWSKYNKLKYWFVVIGRKNRKFLYQHLSYRFQGERNSINKSQSAEKRQTINHKLQTLYGAIVESMLTKIN